MISNHERELPGRREVLVLGVAGLALIGCAPKKPPPPVIHTVSELLATTPFYVAHRGSGDNWPEHTQIAYRNAVAAGATAIEVSVHSTRDGVLVCHHDDSTLRMTGKDLDISRTDYALLAELDVNASAWLGPNSVVARIPKLVDVLEEHAPYRVVFIEDKQGTNTAALLEILGQYQDPTEHFVWKQPAPSRRVESFAAQGYKSWGYFSEADFDKVAELAADFDLVGIPGNAPEQVVKTLVSSGKPVMCWDVHSRSVRDAMTAWGVRGFMCSNYPYVASARHVGRNDLFATGLRAAGDLPMPITVERQPQIVAGSASIIMHRKEKVSYSMGSLCPVTEENYSITFSLAWPERVPFDSDHLGLAFAQISDAPYLVREKSTIGGYHMVLRGNGSMELFVRPAGQVSGHQLGAVLTEKPQAGRWMQFRVQLGPQNIRVERIDGGGWALSVDDATFRGGYFSLCRNYNEGPAAEFRGVTVGVA